MVFSLGQTDAGMTANGRTVNSMVLVLIFLVRVRLSVASGLKESVSLGSTVATTK
jgi:hypothetical protein